jgi:glycosyltransferase involved in cell wall biosynthesis
MANRVLLVDQSLGVGGSIVSLYQLVRGLDRARVEPTVLLFDGNPHVERFQRLGIEVVLRPWGNKPPRDFALGADGQATAGELRRTPQRYIRRSLAILKRASDFRRLLRKVRPDAIHFNNVIAANRAEILASRGSGVPTLCHVRGFSPLSRLDQWLAGGITRYIFISRAIADWFLASGVEVRSWDVVYNGVDTTEFYPMPGAREAVRSELGLPQDAQVVATVGRLVPWKGQEVFVNALERLASEYPSLLGLVVGSALSGEFERYIRAKVEAGPMRGRIIFTGHRSDVNRVLAGADVLVHASTEPEPFGRVVVEGMAAGIPVIASAEGAVPEIIEDGKTGLMFPPGDHVGLAQALERVIATPDLAQRLSRSGRREVEMRFRSELYVAGVEAVYDAAIRGVA